MTTTTENQAKGDFYAPLNRYKQAGDNKPMFTGTLQAPGTEPNLPFALWPFDYTDTKTGEIKRGFTGGINGVAANIPAQAQIDALMADVSAGKEAQIRNLTLRPGQIVLFTNGFKDEEPEKNRPDFYGYVNPLDGSPYFEVSTWLKKFEGSGKPYLSGQTQFPLPGKSAAKEEAPKTKRVAPPPPPARKRDDTNSRV